MMSKMECQRTANQPVNIEAHTSRLFTRASNWQQTV